MSAVACRGAGEGSHGLRPMGSWGQCMQGVQRMQAWWAELRIDVDLSVRDVERELQRLYERLLQRERLSQGTAILPLSWRGLEFRHREADGEHFIYVIDPVPGRIVAYVSLQRLVEVDRRTDRLLRSPHTRVVASHRRMRIASTVYRWWLDSGRSFMTGARQSPGAHGLWMSLARDYPVLPVCVRDKRLVTVPTPLPADFFERLDTRLVLLGRGCRSSDLVAPVDPTPRQEGRNPSTDR